MSMRRMVGYVDQLVRRSIGLMLSVALPNGPHAHSNVSTVAVRPSKRCLSCLEEPVYLTAASVSPEGIRLLVYNVCRLLG